MERNEVAPGVMVAEVEKISLDNNVQKK